MGFPPPSPMPHQTPKKVLALVGFVCLAAAATLTISWVYRQPFPGVFALGSFLIVALLVQHLYTQLRVQASGSIAFVVHLTAGILFGGFWAATITIVATLVTQILRQLPPIRVIFNVGQRVLALTGAFLVYQGLGGNIPPEYLRVGGEVSSIALQLDIFLFFVLSVVYFTTNSILVSFAIALSTERRFKDVWTLNTRGVLGYDLGASAIAILVGWFYVHAQDWIPLGLGPASLVAIVLPVVVLRHIYGMYYRLQQNGRELLAVMVKAMEARDPYTSGHSVRVSTLAKMIAVEMRLPTNQVEEIGTAGLLHDVGKIYEEFAPLLRKADKLTDEEFALMQTHSAKGAELVGVISSFRGPIQGMVLSHHERWDGKGYPNGTEGGAIPLGSRIIMVCDTIDAMMTDRPYRKALGFDAVLAELQRCRESQFDPRLVDMVESSLAVRRTVAEQIGKGILPTQKEPDGPRHSRRVASTSKPFWRSRLG